MIRSRITTVDNPFDPFDQFQLWYEFDESHGYHSCSFVARLCYDSNGIGVVDNQIAMETAIDTIVDMNPKLYKKVQQNVECEADSVFKI